MAGGVGEQPNPPAANAGDFLLSLLQNQHHLQQQQQQHQTHPQQQHQQQQQQLQHSLTVDPAVAAVGPSLPFAPLPWPSISNGPDLPYPLFPWSHSVSPPSGFPPNFLGFPQNPFPPPRNQFPGNHFPGNQIAANHILLGEDSRTLAFPGNDARGSHRIDKFIGQQKHQEPELKFGSFPSEIRSTEGLLKENSEGSLDSSQFTILKERETGSGSRSYNGLDRNMANPRANSESNQNSDALRRGNYISREQERRGGELGKQYHSGNYKSTPPPPPGFPSQPRGKGNWDSGNGRGLEHNVDKEMANYLEFGNSNVFWEAEDFMMRRLSMKDGKTRGEKLGQLALSGQLDHPGPPTGSNLHSVSAPDMEKSISKLHSEIDQYENGNNYRSRDKLKEESHELDDFSEQLVDSLLLDDESAGKHSSSQRRISREKDARKDNRGKQLLSQRMRIMKRQMQLRSDIGIFNEPFLAIYESLIPAEEEKAKQKQLLELLERLVCKEWPNARIYLYGSCANSFGVSKSDIDVCLAIEYRDTDKSEILLRLADILQSDNLQNVQALTRARVPIVKLMDPMTGLSCDICINNVLAVINTKLLRDYAQIDARLRQLAFIVKHWAKSRGVNETYQGTLSSYAYVIMCIHFLQQRRPAILPCLQEMETTYLVTVDDIECAFFDQVEKLHNFGSRNKETIAQLVWAFFNYWAYRHDYANSVISVRTGSIISKQEKDWTRRIGNDRHLICIEDPFEVSHDLGRVVDKHSIKVLREEFERAADIMQHDPNPWRSKV
ncbi:hypothetical protein CIPAW_01G259000 [Carya illinoinensis]|uniref:RNA uridylyltransferase n=1 Tax=Carya illinoinensis TaxID=32201 RepID=A0A8T1RSH7_CARIL|nr:hypothetical protein CIPAW_01G259000 [Carya illinoinensis]KAG6734175.1 hypothetical protein I3842_01G260700 [Carya illinoinensis]